jgi:hypothetical protein
MNYTDSFFALATILVVWMLLILIANGLIALFWKKEKPLPPPEDGRYLNEKAMKDWRQRLEESGRVNYWVCGRND